MSAAEAAGIILGAASLLFAVVSYARERKNRQQEIDLLRRQVLGDSAAEPVLVRLGVSTREENEPFTLTMFVRNVGPAAARDVTVELRVPVEDKPAMMFQVAEASVSAALLAGEGHRVDLDTDRATFERDDLFLFVTWEDANGYQERDLGYVGLLLKARPLGLTRPSS